MVRNYVVLALLLCSIVSCGDRTKKEKPVPVEKSLAADSTAFDMIRYDDRLDHLIGTKELGTIHEGEILKGMFVLRNKTEEPLVLLDMRVSCGCLTLDYDKRPVGQNKTVEVPFLYNSTGKEGRQLSRVMIETNVSKYEVLLKIDVKANE